jgi:tetratricopeptide (TPR) repeat protein
VVLFPPKKSAEVLLQQLKWKLAAAIGIAAVAVAVALVVVLRPRSSNGTLDPDRVMVAVLDNQTGIRSLDLLGVMAGHWITQGLQQSGVVRVVPWLEAQQASQYVRAGLEARTVTNPVLAVAEETGAGIVVWGIYSRTGGTVQYQLEVTDVARRRSLGALDPESAPLASPDDAIEPLRERVMGLLAHALDERIAAQAGDMARPPSFEAYRAFYQGVTHYVRHEEREALPYLSQAFELDTTFTTALIYATLIRNNRGEWAQSDSLVRILERHRDRLSEYDRQWVDYLKARVSGDEEAALQAMRRAAEMAPGSNAVYNRAWLALIYSNRPQEAVDALLTLDPERGPMRGWIAYHAALCGAYVRLHEHEKALEAARRLRETFANQPVGLLWEGLALVGLGRIEETNGVLDEILAWPQAGLWQGYYFTVLAAWLRLNGHADAAQRVIARGVEWYEARPPETKASASWRAEYARALYVANRCDEGYGVAKPLADESPEDLDQRGFVGILAACRGDREAALETSRWLEALDRPYLRGDHTRWRSLILGELGDRDNAVGLLRQAYAEGSRYIETWSWERLPLESLRGYAPYEELMRPKG